MNIFLLLLTLFTFVFIHISQAQEFRFLRPVPDNIETNGSYLYAEPNINNSSLGHRGIDIRIKYDTVYSASDGIIDFVGYNPNDTIGGYETNGGGNYITVKSQWNGKIVYLYYMHLTKPLVNTNNSILVGQPIAISGNTGNSTGAHLHFEIRMNTKDYSASRTRRNPELWVGITGTGAIYGHVPNAPNNTRVDISPYPKPRPPYTTFGWALTYNFNDPAIGSDDIYNENYAIGDVKPGTYTIKALNNTYVRTVTVGPGEIVNADLATNLQEQEILVDNYKLEQNYPNPFNPGTTINFRIPEKSFVRLKIFDILGNEVSTLVNEERAPGIYNEYFDAVNFASGVYVYTLTAHSLESVKIFRSSMKMMVVK